MNRMSSRVSALLKLAEGAPPKTIVQTINGLLAILRKKGVAIVDFEDNSRKVHGFKIFTNTAYLLAAKEQTPEGDADGEHNRK